MHTRSASPPLGSAPTRRHRLSATRALAAAAGLIALVVGGCAMTPPSEVTDAQARDRFVALLDETQRAAGGQWKVKDDPSPRECVVPLWVSGQRFPGLRTGPAPEGDVGEAAALMQRYWTDSGLRTTVSELGDVVEVKAESPHGELVLFRVSDSAMTLTGESECRPT